MGERFAEQSLGNPPAVYEIELRERMVRVEKELTYQREIFQTVLEQIDKRFKGLQQPMDRRFDALTRRMDRFTIWPFGITVGTGALVVSILKLWP